MLSKQPWSQGPRTRAHCFRLRLMALTHLSLPLTSAPANGASPNRDTYLRLPMNMMPLVLPFTGARNGVLDPVQHVPRTHAVVEAFRNASRPLALPCVQQSESAHHWSRTDREIGKIMFHIQRPVHPSTPHHTTTDCPGAASTMHAACPLQAHSSLARRSPAQDVSELTLA